MNNIFIAFFFLFIFLFYSCEIQPKSETRRPQYELHERKDGVDYIETIIAGDVGEGGIRQALVAGGMRRYAKSIPIDFVVLLGDNFYEDGVESTSDWKFDRFFEHMYDRYVLDMKFYAILGNHDYKGNIRAQIKYSEKSSRWRMPDRYYKFTKTIDDDIKILYVFLDTFKIRDDDEKQINWLESTLQNSNAHWKVVFGHDPMFSNGKHGGSSRLYNEIGDILINNGVDVYFAGHEHNLQLLDPTGGVYHVVSGAGGKLDYVETKSNTIYAYNHLGFAVLRVSINKLIVLFVLDDGEVDYCKILKRS